MAKASACRLDSIAFAEHPTRMTNLELAKITKLIPLNEMIHKKSNIIKRVRKIRKLPDVVISKFHRDAP